MRHRHRMLLAAVLAVAATAAAVPGVAAETTVEDGASATAAVQRARQLDYCGEQCADILPPGQNGNATIEEIEQHRQTGALPPHAGDQLAPYAALADGYDDLTVDGIDEFFNDASFGMADDDIGAVVRPRHDVTIVRDRTTGVPHVYGGTRAGTGFGAGYAAAQDRLWVMDVLRHAGRGELTPLAGGAPANQRMEQQFFASAPYTEQELRRQFDALAEHGGHGNRVIEDVRNYVAGINAYVADATEDRSLPGEYVLTGNLDPESYEHGIAPFTETDVVVLAQIIGAQFGSGGGGEVDAAIAKLAVQERYGAQKGERVWRTLRNADEPEAVKTLHDGQRFPYAGTPKEPQGRALPDAGTVAPQRLVFDQEGGQGEQARADGAGVFDPAAMRPRGMSNALVVSGEHTDSGDPMAVFGPQVGYLAPQLLMLQELQGPGISARGASFAGLSMYVLLGRGQDYAWSATSAGQDITDTYALELCSPDGSAPDLDADHYRFRGDCVPMDVVERENAWTPSTADPTPAGSYTLRAYRTVYGPVTHRGLVDGEPVVYSALRSTYFHEADSLIGLSMVNDPRRVGSAGSFQRAISHVSYAFNWFYVDSDDTAYYNSGANPVRQPEVDPSMPIRGDAGFDWRDWDPETNTAAYTRFAEHPHSVNQDYYVSWNNAQANGYSAAKYERGSVHRADILDDAVARLVDGAEPVTRATLTAAMAEAGLTDLRGARVLPTLLRVLDAAEVGDPELAAALDRLRAWHADGSLRSETSAGSRTYAHQEAIRIMDAWWPLLVRAQFIPGLGDDAYGAMSAVLPIDQHPGAVGHGGSAFQVGWWGYVDKDLRALLGDEVAAPLGDAFCGDGELDACRRTLLDTLETAVHTPAAEVYPGEAGCEAGDPWCAETIVHRPLGGITQQPISWQNRGTYQQVVEFPVRRGGKDGA